MRTQILLLASLFLWTSVSAEVKVKNDKFGETVEQTLTVTKATDIGPSPMKGFIKIVVNNSDPKLFLIRHIPISQIRSIKQANDYLYINFKDRLMQKDGVLCLTLVIPRNVIPFEHFFNLINHIKAN